MHTQTMSSADVLENSYLPSVQEVYRRDKRGVFKISHKRGKTIEQWIRTHGVSAFRNRLDKLDTISIAIRNRFAISNGAKRFYIDLANPQWYEQLCALTGCQSIETLTGESIAGMSRLDLALQPEFFATMKNEKGKYMTTQITVPKVFAPTTSEVLVAWFERIKRYILEKAVMEIANMSRKDLRNNLTKNNATTGPLRQTVDKIIEECIRDNEFIEMGTRSVESAPWLQGSSRAHMVIKERESRCHVDMVQLIHELIHEHCALRGLEKPEHTPNTVAHFITERVKAFLGEFIFAFIIENRKAYTNFVKNEEALLMIHGASTKAKLPVERRFEWLLRTALGYMNKQPAFDAVHGMLFDCSPNQERMSRFFESSAQETAAMAQSEPDLLGFSREELGEHTASAFEQTIRNIGKENILSAIEQYGASQIVVVLPFSIRFNPSTHIVLDKNGSLFTVFETSINELKSANIEMTPRDTSTTLIARLRINTIEIPVQTDSGHYETRSDSRLDISVAQLDDLTSNNIRNITAFAGGKFENVLWLVETPVNQ